MESRKRPPYTSGRPDARGRIVLYLRLRCKKQLCGKNPAWLFFFYMEKGILLLKKILEEEDHIMKLYLLNDAEANSMTEKNRIITAGAWWLRTIETDKSEVYPHYIDRAGKIVSGVFSFQNYLRPAITLRSGSLEELKRIEGGAYILGHGKNGRRMEWIKLKRKGTNPRLILKDHMGDCSYGFLWKSSSYESSSICTYLYRVEGNLFTEEELGLLCDAPEGLISIRTMPYMISKVRKYFSDLGIMEKDDEPSDILERLTDEEQKLVIQDLKS